MARRRVGTSKAAVPALPSTWSFLGPQPITEKANFTGSAIGSSQPMTGRLTSVAADATGLIVAGAASGGLWVSTNNGGSFASVFDSQPTQAIGAIALDTTTNPSTIYVGTGEGNNSIDSLYGSGIFRSTDLGQHWTPLGPPERSTARRSPRWRSIPQRRPARPRIFAGTTSGFSGSRADAGIFETDATKAGLWFSANGGRRWTHYPECTFGNCDLLGDGTAPCAADDVVIDPSNPSERIRRDRLQRDLLFQQRRCRRSMRLRFPACTLSRVARAWRRVPVGFPLGPVNPTGGVVYAMIGAGDGVEYAGMFVSFDAGATLECGHGAHADDTVLQFRR